MKKVFLLFKCSLEHKMNPLHVYCRLVEAGLDKKVARYLATKYEFFIFRRVIRLKY